MAGSITTGYMLPQATYFCQGRFNRAPSAGQQRHPLLASRAKSAGRQGNFCWPLVGHRHCERSAAIQCDGLLRLDCFVASLLAMTIPPAIVPITPCHCKGPPRHCERSEAIQRDGLLPLDCFVASLLAMTGEQRTGNICWPGETPSPVQERNFSWPRGTPRCGQIRHPDVARSSTLIWPDQAP
jgi:hypothetical protein